MHFHHETMKSLVEIIEAMGLEGPQDLRPWHVMRRVSETESKSYAELFEYIPEGSLLQNNNIPSSFETVVKLASSESFRPLFI